MSLSEIKAYIHNNRVADVVGALVSAGFDKLSVIEVHGLLQALDNKEQHYSVELGQKIVNEVKLEVVCDSDARCAEAIEIIREQGRTGQASAGWIYVSPIRSAIEISD